MAWRLTRVMGSIMGWRPRRMCRRWLIAVVPLAALVAVPAGSAADLVLYVDQANPSCSDAGAGTASQPFCTIGAAAAKVGPGQTVEVAAGTYTEAVTVPVSGTSSAPVLFRTAPGATVVVTGKTNGFVVSGRSWVEIRGFTVTNTSSFGIYVSSSSNVTVAGNRVSYAGQPMSGKTATGIRLAGTTASLVEGNTADHNTYAGIELNGGSTGDEVRGNTTFANASVYTRRAPGIRLYSAPGNTVRENVSHDNEDSGIECYTGSNNTLLVNNVAFANGDHGLDNYQTTGQRLISNTVYKNVTAGINVEGASTGATIRNNVSVDNGIKSPRTASNIRVERGSTDGTSMDSDLVYLTTSGVMLIWDSTSYSSLAAFQAATGREPRGEEAPPLWRNPSAGDFHLTAGSPAIDSADSGVAGQPAADVEGNPRVDDPAMPNTGTGPRPYDDRGAFEFQPGPASDAPPVAALTVTPSFGAINLKITADASASIDTDATPIDTYAFDFGDGTVVGAQAIATADHTYTTPGTYTVTVTVTDTAGLSSSASSTVTVIDNPPSASLKVTASPKSRTVTADASASTDTDATPIATYTFTFGDGSPPIGPQGNAKATHTYATSGTYTVTVTVTDTAGLTATASKTIKIR
jgi:parallel beta-helix repeat protein